MITPKPKQLFTQSSQSGFTIIESLMAVIVVSVLMAAIAPAIGISVATRVQAKRIEQASQAARAYVDGIKTATIVAPLHTVTQSRFATLGQTALPTAVEPPTSTSSWSCPPPTTTPATTTNYYCANSTTSSLYCIDGDGIPGCSSNSIRDLIIQSFRTTDDQNYLVGVRVYRADGFKTAGNFDDPNPDDQPTQQSTFTGGLGKLKFPLLQMTTEITGTQAGYQDYCDRLGGCT